MQGPPLKVSISNLDHRFIIDVDGPDALVRWCLELALLLCGQSSSFTAVSSGEWEGTLWFGLDPKAEEDAGIRREEGRLLVFAPRVMVEQWLRFSIDHYRHGRIRFPEADWGDLTLKLSGPAWHQIPGPDEHRPKRRRR